MSDSTHVPIETQRCSINISGNGIDIYFHPALPEGKHVVSRAELMAAGALMGIAGVLTGKGADEVLNALVRFERETKRKVRR